MVFSNIEIYNSFAVAVINLACVDFVIMSSDNTNINRDDTKFTRGEKCIFVHLIVTFLLIIILVIVYFVHLCLVDHRGSDIFKISRRRIGDKNGLFF